MTSPSHLDAETIYALIEGRLEPGRDRAAESHLWRCDACRAFREECGATLGGLRWYGERTPSAPEGYWEGFWRRWPVAGNLDVVRRRRALGARRLVAWPTAAAAVIAMFAAGLWWAAGRQDPEATRLASRATANFAGGTAAERVGGREVMAGTSWEDDMEVLRRVTFTIGSVDPLSKGVILASMAEEP